MAKQNSPMEAGERVPNFFLKDQWNKDFHFYVSITGGPIVFVVLAPGDEGNKALLRALEKKLPEFEAQNAHLYAISDDTVESHAALSRELDLHFPLFADPEGQVTGWFLTTAQVQAPVVFVLDPNQRLISLKSGANGEASTLPGHALREVTKIAPKGKPRVFSEVAPVLFVPNVFTPDYCQHLIELWQAGDHTDGMIRSGGEQKKDPYVKRRKDYSIVSDMEKVHEIRDIIGPRLGPEAEKIYYYGSFVFEAFRIGCYEDTDAGFFKPHRDNFSDNLEHRRYAVSINLNTGEYEGGDLRFPEYGPDLYRPPTGGAIVFSCCLLHEVLPVTKGRRFVFLTFLGGSPKSKGNAGSG